MMEKHNQNYFMDDGTTGSGMLGEAQMTRKTDQPSWKLRDGNNLPDGWALDLLKSFENSTRENEAKFSETLESIVATSPNPQK